MAFIPRMVLRCFPWLPLLLLLPSLATIHASQDKKDQCVYTVYVRTGTALGAGTDARIGMALNDASGKGWVISDLVTWGGLKGPRYNYFANGAVDAFTGLAPCGLNPPVCRLNLTSDGSGGVLSAWYCEYVEVITTGPHIPCTKTLFNVRQWLATDVAPFKLYALVDQCSKAVVTPARPHGQSPFFVSGEHEREKAATSSSI